MSGCFHCEKTSMLGRSHTHKRGVAGGRWKKKATKTRRIFRANLHKMLIVDEGKKKTIKLCAKCIKRIRFDLSEGQRPFLQLYQAK